MSRQFVILALVALLAAGGGYFVASRLGEPPLAAVTPLTTPATRLAVPAPETLVGRRRADFSLADAAGNVLYSRVAERFGPRVSFSKQAYRVRMQRLALRSRAAFYKTHHFVGKRCQTLFDNRRFDGTCFSLVGMRRRMPPIIWNGERHAGAT